jgi:AraC family transcriptional regulator
MRQNPYKQLMNLVVNHIHQHINGDLSLHTLAKIASFSPFHFHRMFKAMMGETVNDYVKRIRVQKAATKLLYSNLPVTEIAFDCGFSSVSTLSRAFKQHYGVSPSAYRRKPQHSKICKAESKNGNNSSKDTVYDDTKTAVETIRKRSLMSMKVEVKTFRTSREASMRSSESRWKIPAAIPFRKPSRKWGKRLITSMENGCQTAHSNWMTNRVWKSM